MSYCARLISFMITVYGIKNCDTVKKACNWLVRNNIAFQFHDFRNDGLTQTKVRQWTSLVAWDKLINRRGSTWRALSDQDKTGIDSSRALQLMVERPTLIKRPVVEYDTSITVGFSQESYAEIFTPRG